MANSDTHMESLGPRTLPARYWLGITSQVFLQSSAEKGNGQSHAQGYTGSLGKLPENLTHQGGVVVLKKRSAPKNV